MTVSMLWALCTSLNLGNLFEACIWVMIICTFWGMMCFGEVSVSSCSAFNMNKHLKWWDTFFGLDLDNKHYVQLDLPSTKIAKLGEVESVFMLKVTFAQLRHFRTYHTLSQPDQTNLCSCGETFCVTFIPWSRTPLLHTSTPSSSPWLGHDLQALLLHWWNLLLPCSENRSWNYLPCRMLVIPHLWSVHLHLWIDCLMSSQQCTESPFLNWRIRLGLASHLQLWLFSLWVSSLIFAPCAKSSWAHFPTQPYSLYTSFNGLTDEADPWSVHISHLKLYSHSSTVTSRFLFTHPFINHSSLIDPSYIHQLLAFLLLLLALNIAVINILSIILIVSCVWVNCWTKFFSCPPSGLIFAPCTKLSWACFPTNLTVCMHLSMDSQMRLEPCDWSNEAWEYSSKSDLEFDWLGNVCYVMYITPIGTKFECKIWPLVKSGLIGIYYQPIQI